METRRFRISDLETDSVYLQASKDEQAILFDLIMRWLELDEELAELIVEIQNKRVEKANVRALYLNEFDDEVFRVEDAYALMLLLMEVRDEFTKNPLWTRAKKKAVRAGKLAEYAGRRRKLKLQISTAHDRRLQLGKRTFVDEQEIARMHEECKALARQCHRVLHPDILQNNRAFLALNGRNKKEIRKLQRRLMRIRDSDARYDPESYGFDHVAPSVLQSILYSAQAILGGDCDHDIDSPLVGKTSSTRIAWLRQETTRLASSKLAAEKEFQSLMDDDEYKEQKWRLAKPEQYHVVRDALSSQAASYEESVAQLEAELDSMLNDAE